MATRGVLYLKWGNNDRVQRAFERSLASIQRLHPELPVHVQELPAGSSLLDKTPMLDYTPFEETLFLDLDTVVLERLDFAFEKAAQFGLACCICECPWARRHCDARLNGDEIEYNTGVLFFTRKATEVFQTWKRLATEVDSSMIFLCGSERVRLACNDQASFSVAVQQTGFNPFILPQNWNLRPQWQRSFFGPIKIWHDYSEVPADILRWNEAQTMPGHVIHYTNFAA